MSVSLKKDLYFLSTLFVLCLILFGFRLGSFGLLDPDEPFYALTAKEMLLRHDGWTPVLFGQPQFEKPILFYWILYACFKFFGISEFSSRLGPCLAGILTVLITYLWGRVLFRRKEPAFISAVVLATALEFIILSRIVLTDMFLCLFVTAALFCFTVGAYGRAPNIYRKTAWIFVFVFCALGFLTKGPLGVLLPFFGIISYICVNEAERLRSENCPSKGLDNASATEHSLTPRALSRSEFASAGQTNVPARDNSRLAGREDAFNVPWVLGSAIFLLIAAPWYAAMTVQHGPGFLKDFFIHENLRRFFVPEHKSFDTFLFYPAAVWIGFFPWSAFVPGALLYGLRQTVRGRWKIFSSLFLSFALTFLFFVAAKSKLLSYIFPVFPAVALLTGGWLYRVYRAFGLGAKPKFFLTALCFVFFVLFVPGLVGVVGILNSRDKMGVFRPIAGIALTVIPVYWLAFFSFWKKKYKLAFIFTVTGTVIFSALSFGWLLPSADGLFSSKYKGAIYREEAGLPPQNFILAGKLFVRGASYYTGSKNVGVLTDDPGSVFYTKHPIPILSTREDILKIPASQFPVYCFFRPKELKFLRQLVDGHFSITLIQQNSERIFVRLERVA